jgi:hypothetical protein
LTFAFAPRSTCSQRVAAAEQNLSLLPPLALPFTASPDPSVVAHAALPVAALFSARFVPDRVGAVVGVGSAIVGVGAPHAFDEPEVCCLPGYS